MPASDITRVRRFYERGLFFVDQNQFADACTNFKDALNLNPNFLPARIQMAVALSQQHKYVDAIKLLEDGRKQVALRPDEQVEVLGLLGNICLIRQDYKAAVYYLRAARKIDPKSMRLRQMLATCYCKSGQYEAGLELLLENAHEMDAPAAAIEL
jgi:predicted Zn-dependent protease